MMRMQGMKKTAFILMITVVLLSSLAHAHSNNIEQFRTRLHVISNITGVRLFYNVKDLGDGIVEVTASSSWISRASADDKADNMHTLFKLWKEIEGSDLGVVVHIVVGRGRAIMTESEYGLIVY